MLAPQVFIEKDGKPPIGAAVDYWEEYLAPEMKVNVEWVGPVNIRRLTKEALKGRIDAILVFAKNPERLKNFDFLDHSYTQMVAGLAFRKRIDAAFDAMSISLKYEAVQLGFADQLKILQVPGTELKNYTAFPKSGNG